MYIIFIYMNVLKDVNLFWSFLSSFSRLAKCIPLSMLRRSFDVARVSRSLCLQLEFPAFVSLGKQIRPEKEERFRRCVYMYYNQYVFTCLVCWVCNISQTVNLYRSIRFLCVWKSRHQHVVDPRGGKHLILRAFPKGRVSGWMVGEFPLKCSWLWFVMLHLRGISKKYADMCMT